MTLPASHILIAMLPAVFLLNTYMATSFDDERDTVETWEGSLRLFGNEPFTRVALVTDDGERWYLEMDEVEMQQLWKDRRGRIRITGVPLVKEFSGRTENHILVKKFSWIADSG